GGGDCATAVCAAAPPPSIAKCGFRSLKVRRTPQHLARHVGSEGGFAPFRTSHRDRLRGQARARRGTPYRSAILPRGSAAAAPLPPVAGGRLSLAQRTPDARQHIAR